MEPHPLTCAKLFIKLFVNSYREVGFDCVQSMSSWKLAVSSHKRPGYETNSTDEPKMMTDHHWVTHHDHTAFIQRMLFRAITGTGP